jgi:growth factor-regulated tyrosine kinase substrate
MQPLTCAETLLDLHAKLSTVVRYYDRMLEERLSSTYTQANAMYGMPRPTSNVYPQIPSGAPAPYQGSENYYSNSAAPSDPYGRPQPSYQSQPQHPYPQFDQRSAPPQSYASPDPYQQQQPSQPSQPTSNLPHRKCNAKCRANTHHNRHPTTRPNPKHHPPTSPMPTAPITTTTTPHRHPSSAHTATPHSRRSPHHRRCTTARRRNNSSSSSRHPSRLPSNPQLHGRTRRTRERMRRRNIRLLHSSRRHRSSIKQRLSSNSGSNPNRFPNRPLSNSRVIGILPRRTRWVGMGRRASLLRRRVSQCSKRSMSR